MPLVAAKCTNCGGHLQVESEKEAMVCNHCNTAFIVEKAIHNYSSGNSIDELLSRATTFMQLGENAKAFGVYKNISDLFPADYRGWWGMFNAATNNANINLPPPIQMNDAHASAYLATCNDLANDLASKAITLASSEKSNIESVYTNWTEQNERIALKINAAKAEIDKINEEKNKQQTEAMQDYPRKLKEYESLKKKIEEEERALPGRRSGGSELGFMFFIGAIFIVVGLLWTNFGDQAITGIILCLIGGLCILLGWASIKNIKRKEEQFIKTRERFNDKKRDFYENNKPPKQMSPNDFMHVPYSEIRKYLPDYDALIDESGIIKFVECIHLYKR